MIPFKGLVSDLGSVSGWGAIESDDYENGSEREKETREYKRFSSYQSLNGSSISSSSRNGRTETKVIQGVEITGESDDHVAFWSCLRIRDNVRLKGGIWQELSGALGDSGTLVPAVLALALVNGLDLGTTLLFTGICNLGTGLLFGIPISVQPMSAIVLAALGPNPLNIPQIMAAGMITGLALGILGITGLMNLLCRLIPIPVVRGVMLCEGLTTGFRALKYILEKQDLPTMQSLGARSWLGVDGLLLPISMLLFLVVVSGVGRSSNEEELKSIERLGEDGEESGMECLDLLSRGNTNVQCRYTEYEAQKGNWRKAVLTVPTALIILLTALSLAIVRNPSILNSLHLGPSPVKVIKISLEDWKVGLLQAAVYQIPVSILSSVISISRLSSDYFPGEKVNPTSLCLSVWVMNMLGCWFGAVPVCHGAVGLAGQYRFGARSGLSMVMLGTVKLVLGLLLGSSSSGILAQFPVSLLGILLLSSGLELAIVCRDQNTRHDALVMLAVAVVSIGASSAYNTSVGFVCGLILYLVVRLHEWLED